MDPAPPPNQSEPAELPPVNSSAKLLQLNEVPVSPLRELWTIAWPTVLTMTSYTIMQFVDALMVSRVGTTELAAQGNGGIFAFAPLAIALGLVTVVNTFVSQNLGAGYPERTPRYAWNALWLAFFCALILLPYGMALPTIFTTLQPTAEPLLIELESQYGQILIFGAFLTISSRALNNFFFGLHRPKCVFVGTVVGNLVNVGANYLLIFGRPEIGIPELGLAGAAYGTLIGTAAELVIPMAVFLGPKMNRELQTRRAWVPDRVLLWDLLRLGWPRALTFGNELICWAIFMVLLVGKFGEAHLTAGWITLRYMHLSFMPAVGISVAISAVVGKYIGAGKPDIANQRAYLAVKIAVLYMGFCAFCFIVFRSFLIEYFIRTDDAVMAATILSAGSKLLICAAVFQIFDGMAITFSGALTGAGDTLWPGVANVLASWIFILGFGWGLTVWWPELESVGPWLGAALFIISLGIAYYFRWRAGRWRKIKLVRPGKNTEDSD